MATPLRLLLVEDSEDDAALLLRELKRGGYAVRHQRVDTPEAMHAALDSQEWDLVISDHSMPHFSGSDALRLLRSQKSDIPFFFVSGTLGEDTAVAALKTGAQDYLMKSNLARLVPAIQRELHECQQRRERKHLENQVQQLQKFEAIGQLAGGIAHDFNNVLGAISGWAELASADAEPGSRLHSRLQKILEQTKRAAELTAHLLAFARRQVLKPIRLDLNAQVEESMNLLRRLIGAQIEIRIHPSHDLRVTLADPVQIDQVILNLCVNARDAMPDGGRLEIKTWNVEVDENFCRLQTYGKPGSYVALSVTDTGTGMDRSVIDHIFEPFFTTKEMGKGTGLGLATVYGIVKQHNGFINVESEIGKGTTFTMYLPAESGSPDEREAELDNKPRRGTETILLAEDHDGLRQSAQETLEALGYKVLVARDGREAVQLFQSHRDQVDAVVLDVVMPGLTGPAAYQQMAALCPGLGVIFTTGYINEAASLKLLMEQGALMLQKPYNPKSLTQMIGSVVANKSAPRPS